MPNLKRIYFLLLTFSFAFVLVLAADHGCSTIVPIWNSNSRTVLKYNKLNRYSDCACMNLGRRVFLVCAAAVWD